MCRSIKLLRQGSTPLSDEEVRAASLQFVRKISGYRTPSRANELTFDRAVGEIAIASSKLLNALEYRVRARS